ncbi:aminotransferase class I/II-fold pyridoxal phosphate-dependent enzyme [Solirubrobacter phytolaccae]|uniref:Aminotransferase class I/II-fold pyridoxal phosphate-dependent enzyme n=1 Tax=Solirubrobacter phytolaccae TaxID=1404360 RepID=A0A9X3N527_9ACTN|nr:aminotransferase class I/II-fold pyridoxal phosphate-dependent enzyme [Solirubrobacter phytolaccae]MDA0180040.1 aminotransferase class I/II-fold pyridoxal phosphate-dependent enzyme [Solirubrobacter phytolaccae]
MSEPLPFFAAQRTWAEHGQRYAALMAEALATGQALQGPAVAAFEAALAERCGRRHAVAVGSGTDALFFALVAAGVGPGDEVLVPAISFIATASCVLRAGAMPVFVDVDPWLRLDLDAARAARTPATKALIAVDLYGQTVDPDAFTAFATEHGTVLIEDAAQALGAQSAGSIGRLSCCSFDPTKTIAAPGSGGAVLCDDDEAATRLRRLRWHGRDEDGRFATLGYNSQLPSASAAVLHDKLAYDVTWTARRRAIAAAYDEALAHTEHRPVGVAPGRDHVFHKYVLRTPDRAALADTLAAAGIPTRIHYDRPLYREPVFGGGAHDCPAAEAACREVLSLPIHAYLSDAEVEHVTAALRK